MNGIIEFISKNWLGISNFLIIIVGLSAVWIYKAQEKSKIQDDDRLYELFYPDKFPCKNLYTILPSASLQMGRATALKTIFSFGKTPHRQ